MLFRHDPRSGVPIYRQLEEQVQRGVLSGALAEGEKLPTVREVAADLGVNPMTVSKAYSLLEAGGWLERRRGVGLFVLPRPETDEDKERLRVVTASLREAAFCAAQMGIPLQDALRILGHQYSQFNQDEE